MDIILEKGELLFHGTGEEFEVKKIRPGGDRLIWTAESPDIAQNYIPISGAYTIIDAGYLTRPRKDSTVQKLQQQLGLIYDYDDVEWDYMDEPLSFPLPIGWDHLPAREEIIQMMKNLGYQKESYGWDAYKVRMTYRGGENRLMLPGEKLLGRLIIFKVKQPLKIFDFTLGGERESDLMNLDYNRFDIFEVVENRGYDGIKINDFAQSDIWGNLAHTSIGLFRRALLKLRWNAILATNYDWQDHDDFSAATTPEWETFKKLINLL